MNGYTDEWMDRRWMEGQKDGWWMDVQVDRRVK